MIVDDHWMWEVLDWQTCWTCRHFSKVPLVAHLTKNWMNFGSTIFMCEWSVFAPSFLSQHHTPIALCAERLYLHNLKLKRLIKAAAGSQPHFFLKFTVIKEEEEKLLCGWNCHIVMWAIHSKGRLGTTSE